MVRNGDLGTAPGSSSEWNLSGAAPGTFTAATHRSNDGTPYGIL